MRQDEFQYILEIILKVCQSIIMEVMTMKWNNIIILAILLLPLCFYTYIENKNGNPHDASIAKATKARMVMVTSMMCSACKKMKPVVAKVKPKYSDAITFEIVNANNAQHLVKKHNIHVVPTFLFIDKDGHLKRKIEGGMPQSKLERYLEELK